MPLTPTRADVGEQLRARAERVRAELRRACREGSREACELLQELGELAPAPRHWADRDEDEG